MKRIILPLLICSSAAALAQSNAGIHFEHGLTWTEIKAKAKAENKYIFVDGFTTWCGPCKMMAEEIFPLPEVGAFYNKYFINVAAQLDTTKEDNADVKQWYADAHELQSRYKIRAYPTYLFFDPQGNAVHRSTGSSTDDLFIAVGKDALNPEKQYYTRLRKFENGYRDSAFLSSFVRNAIDSYDPELGNDALKAYAAYFPNLCVQEFLNLASFSTQKSTDPYFYLFRDSAKKVDAAIGQKRRSEIVRAIASREIVAPAMVTQDNQPNPNPDWKSVEATLKKAYGNMAEEILLPAKAHVYFSQKNWPLFREAMSSYLTQYPGGLDKVELNGFAWAVFQACDDPQCLESALGWSRQTLAGETEKEGAYMDTYANLLYKTGKKDEAIAIEQEASKLYPHDESMKVTLDKMKKGEKTW